MIKLLKNQTENQWQQVLKTSGEQCNSVCCKTVKHGGGSDMVRWCCVVLWIFSKLTELWMQKNALQYNLESIWLAVASFFINNDDANTATA